MDKDKFAYVAGRCAPDSDSGCWIWLMAKTRGYGNCRYNERFYKAHRLSYEAVNGEIPEGHVVMHTCDNPSCVNPAHLKAGTQAENVADRDIKGRARHNHVLTEAQRQRIYESQGGPSYLAEKYGVSTATIWKIKNGKIKNFNPITRP